LLEISSTALSLRSVVFAVASFITIFILLSATKLFFVKVEVTVSDAFFQIWNGFTATPAVSLAFLLLLAQLIDLLLLLKLLKLLLLLKLIKLLALLCWVELVFLMKLIELLLPLNLILLPLKPALVKLLMEIV